MTENEKENCNLNFIKEINEDFLKISQVLHCEFEKISNNKISVIDNILSNINSVLINFIHNQSSNYIYNYESLLQKTEMQLRNHIRNENMLRLQRDTLENKIKVLLIRDEEYENLKKVTNVIVENGKFIINDRKENEILILKSENSNLKKAIIKYEIELENKNKKEKELKEQLDFINKLHEEKIKELNKKIEKKLNSPKLNSTISNNESYYSNLLIPSFTLNKKKKMETNSLNVSKSNNFSYMKKSLLGSLGILSDFKTPIKVSSPPYSSRIYSSKNSSQNKHKRYKSDFYLRKKKRKEYNENSFKNNYTSKNSKINFSVNQSKCNSTNIKYSTCITKRNNAKKIFRSKLSQENKKDLNIISLDNRSMNNFIIYKNTKINSGNILTSRNSYFNSNSKN
jgi:hypothetical protein